MFAYVGCRTTEERHARGKGVSVYEIKKDTSWLLKEVVKCKANPSFLCLDESKQFLYTVHGDFSEISAFSIDNSHGHLEYMNTVSTGGVNPVHLSIDKTNHWVFVANLQSGTIAVIPRKEDGSLGNCHALYTIPGKADRTISHPHQVLQDSSREYILVSCQGRKAGFGQVVVFRINFAKGELIETCTNISREIAEPRHMVFHPNGKWCYGVNEKDYSITKYDFDTTEGILTSKQILPTLPDTYTGDGWASGIAIRPDGRFVYVSNRKHDSVTVFSISQEDGRLQYVDCIDSGGKQPRFICITAEGEQLIVANELTDTIRLFDINAQSGRLCYAGIELQTESPVCVIYKD